MRSLRPLCAASLATSLLLAALAAPALASNLYPPAGGQPVSVSVGFNSHLPLPDMNEGTLAEAQRSAREYLYRVSSEECALLKAAIAETCRLTHLNINTQVQQHQPGQPMIYINGNATFSITLKDAAAKEE